MSEATCCTTWSADCPSNPGASGFLGSAIGLTNSLHAAPIVNNMIDQFSKCRLGFALLATIYLRFAGNWSDLFGVGRWLLAVGCFGSANGQRPTANLSEPGHLRRLLGSGRHPRRQRLLPRRLELRLRAGAAHPAVARSRELEDRGVRSATSHRQPLGAIDPRAWRLVLDLCRRSRSRNSHD